MRAHRKHICSGCNAPLTEENRVTGTATCKICRKQYLQQYRARNIEQLRAYDRERGLQPARIAEKARMRTPQEKIQDKARDAIRAKDPRYMAWRRNYTQKYYQEHSQAILTRVAAYAKQNPHKMRAHSARREATELRATPAWATKAYVDMFYAVAREESARLGIKVHVDHIVPLRSPLVCGLHVEHNLQLLTATHNMRKGNRVWPDMPQHHF